MMDSREEYRVPVCRVIELIATVPVATSYQDGGEGLEPVGNEEEEQDEYEEI